MSFFPPKPVTWNVVVSRLESITKQSSVTNGNSLTEERRPQGTPSAGWRRTYNPNLCNPFHEARDLLQETYSYIFRASYLLNAVQQDFYSTLHFQVISSSSRYIRAHHVCTYQNRSDLPHLKILGKQVVRPRTRRHGHGLRSQSDQGLNPGRFLHFVTSYFPSLSLTWEPFFAFSAICI